ncbi:L-type lectin-domain containing receptor kinase IX.1-like [Benincasa hispida]|uniref:L-type lectin-domain containing receptor kinase IX.1-like n=1 Tax=Benincasa hispida TaxID=102211 RepID=UPI0019022AB1|nr:L-type lectin-domain containing receptor kinase IX.1-like [Benincasa hispida]
MSDIENFILYREGIVHSPEDIPLNNNPDSNIFAVYQAIYKYPIPIWDSTTTPKLTSFSTHFTFQFDSLHAKTYGGGFAFFLAPIGWPIPPNSGSGFLGLYKANTQSPPIVHIQFQIGLNAAYPPYEHVGININSLSSSNSTPWDATLHSGDFADVWISYNSKTKDLSVSWEYQSTASSLENSFLSYKVDLSEALPPRVMLGFTATTGLYSLKPLISFWEFDTTLSIQKTNKRISDGSRRNKVNVIVVAVAVPVGVVLISLGLFGLGRWMVKKLGKPKSIENGGEGAIAVGTTS